MPRLLASPEHGHFQGDPQEQDLREAEGERADRCDLVEPGELQRVVRYPARHAGQAQEVHREEGDVEEDHREPEVPFSELLVVHPAGPFGHPEVKSREERKQGPGDEHVVEMRHHVIGILQLDVDRHDRENEAGEPAHGEHEDKAYGEQHRRLEAHRAAPHGREPVEHLHARGHGDQHRCVHEEQDPRSGHTHGEHVVRPHDEREDRDRGGRIHHRGIAEQGLPRERGNHLADDAEAREDHDVDLGVAEEPEDVLEHHRVAAARRVEDRRSEVAVGQQHRDRAREHRHHRDEEVGRDQPRPYEKRHPYERHPRCAHVEDRGDDVDRAHDRGGAHDVEREDREVHPRSHLGRERRVDGPAGSAGAPGHEERSDEQGRSHRKHPEAPVVQARKSHVGSADHHRHLPVGESDEGRHDCAEYHDEPVHRGELVEELRMPELQTRPEQLGADGEREHAADQKHGETEPQIKRSDVLVVGRGDPTHDPSVGAVRLFVVGVA